MNLFFTKDKIDQMIIIKKKGGILKKIVARDDSRYFPLYRTASVLDDGLSKKKRNWMLSIFLYAAPSMALRIGQIEATKKLLAISKETVCADLKEPRKVY